MRNLFIMSHYVLFEGRKLDGSGRSKEQGRTTNGMLFDGTLKERPVK